jgi:hypothetical protein
MSEISDARSSGRPPERKRRRRKVKTAEQVLRALIRNELIRESRGLGEELDEDDFIDEIDYKFAQWALNERRFRLDESDKEYAKKRYGGLEGVVGGVIYSGGKIETPELLRELESLSDGGSIRVNMKSFSHYESVALGFSDFVMSYDPIVGASQMNVALSQGSAGKFGTYLMTVRADESTVIINTLRKGGVTRSAEPELIVDGLVEVVRLKIFKPLTKESWAGGTLREWSSLDDLKGSVFLSKWAKKHGVDVLPELKKFLQRVVVDSSDLAQLFSSGWDIVADNIKEIDEWAQKHPAISDLIRETEISTAAVRGKIRFLFGKRTLSLGEKTASRVLKLKGADVLQANLAEKTGELLSKMKMPLENYKGTFLLPETPFELFWDYCLALLMLQKVGPLKGSRAPAVKDFNSWVSKASKEITPESLLKNEIFHKAALENLSKPWDGLGTLVPRETIALLKGYASSIFSVANSREFSLMVRSLPPDEAKGAISLAREVSKFALKIASSL